MSEKDRNPRRIRSVQHSCALLRAVQQHDGATVSELAEDVSLSMGAVHTHLATLHEEGLIVKENHKYRLSEQFIIYGDYARNNSDLFRAGKAVADKLAEETGESIHLIGEHEGLEVIFYESFGEKAAGTAFYIQNRQNPELHLHYSAAGKAILAHLPESRCEEIIQRYGLVRRTEHTITDEQTLLEELALIRERGFAQNDEEAIKGVRAIGVPVIGKDQAVIGAISLSAPTTRLQGDDFNDTMAHRVMQAANVIKINVETKTSPL
ncbi:IclR family transcriptional regulator [Halocatena halophila]|uniref:IclR family transcriptional regulator n=1 Tax=Halocatena halophila TaxID=2814576 RepID=UPI002ED41C12